MDPFAALPGTLARALSIAGVNAQLTHVSVGVGRNYSPATGSVTQSKTSRTLYAPIGACKRALAPESGLQTGDVLVAAPATAFGTPPKVGDLIVVDGMTYKVVAMDVHRIGATVVLYELQGRRT